MTQLLQILYFTASSSDALLLRYLLEGEQIESELAHACTEEDFQKLLAARKFDIIISDFDTEPFGIPALQTAQQAQPHTPFIFMADEQHEEQAIRTLRAGASDYVFKRQIARFVPVLLREVERARQRDAWQGSERYSCRMERRFKTFLDEQPVAVFIKDAAGRHVYTNRAFLALLNRPADTVLGKTDKELYPAELAAQRRRSDDLVRSSGQASETNETFPAGEGEKYCRVWKFPFDDGEQRCVAGLALDITAQREAHLTVKSSEERFRALFQGAPLGMVLAQKGRVIQVNPAFLTLFGYANSWEVVGTNLLDLFSPMTRQAAAISLDSVKKESVSFDSVGLRRTGQEFKVHFHAAVVRLPTGEDVVAAFCADLTERVRIEEELRRSYKLQALGQFATGVANDFNNLLLIIQGYCTILEESASRENLAPIRQIYAAAERAGQLTDQLLAFSHKHALRTKFIDVNEFLIESFPDYRRLLGEEHKLEFRLGSDAATILGDRALLDQLVRIILQNAKEALRERGSVEASTTLETITSDAIPPNRDARPGEFIRLAISDNGRGMPPEVQQHIFEPFFSTKNGGRGTGLGLSAAYGIIKQHQGWIDVESQPGSGTTISAYFPYAAAEQTMAIRTVPEEAMKATFLLIEDEEQLRTVLATVLESQGYTILQAGTAEEAIALWQRHQDEVPLLVTDLLIPGQLSGADLAKQFRADKPSLKVIYISGYSMEVAMAEFGLEADSVFLHKPFQLQLLAEKIQHLLSTPAHQNGAVGRQLVSHS